MTSKERSKRRGPTEMMRFAIVTAMRRGEQSTLRWDELNSEERTAGCWRKHPKGSLQSCTFDEGGDGYHRAARAPR